MKKFTLVLNLVCFLALGSFAQSMYGDAVKADVKMKYVYYNSCNRTHKRSVDQQAF